MVNIVLLALFSILLVKATDVLIGALHALARATRLGEFAVTGLILSLATTIPEFSVGVVSALEGTPTIALGNVLGSNIANITLVIALGALCGGAVNARRKVIYQDIWYVLGLSVAPLILFVDRTLSRVDALVLIVLYAFYAVALVRNNHHVIEEETGVIRRLLRQITYAVSGHTLDWLKFFGGVVVVILSANGIVRTGTAIATALNIPLLLIGMFFVAVGTSFPEIVFAIRAIRKHKASMTYGNIFGSIVANATLILGVTALIAPITVVAFADYLLAVGVFILAFGLFAWFVRTKHRIGRVEGAILLAVYLTFLVIEFVR